MNTLRRLHSFLDASEPRRYLRSVAWVFASRAGSMAVSLLSTFYIARTLGPHNFGELSYAISIVSLFAFFSAFASSTVVTRDITRNRERQDVVLGSAWFVSCLGTAATVILTTVFMFAVPHDPLTRLVVGILCITQFFVPFQVSQNVFYIRTETKYIAGIQLSVQIVISLAKIIAMILGEGVLVLAVIMFFEQFLISSLSLLFYRRVSARSPLRWRWNGVYARQLVLDSLPFVVISMSGLVAGRIDQIFIEHFIDTATVGLYNVAVQLTEAWQTLPGLLMVSLYPALVNAQTKGRTYRARMLAFGAFLAVYSVAAASVTAFLAPYVVPLIYGSAFVPSVPLVQIYSWSLIGTVCGFLITSFLVTENMRRLQIVTGLVPMLTNVILNLWWIPLYGAEGAAWATVVSYLLAPAIPFLYPAVWRRLASFTAVSN